MDKLLKEAFVRLCDEDLEWLKNQPDSLERQHIEAIVADSPARYYDDNTRIAELEAQLKEREWIRLSKSCPKHGRSYDIWIKSSENDKYGRRIADVIFFEGYFDTKFRQQPVTHPEYISHYSPLPSPPKEQE